MIFLVFQQNALKEFVLPNIDNTDYRIQIDKNIFGVNKSFYLLFEVINKKWSIKTDEKEYQIIHHNTPVPYVQINGKEIINIKTVNGEIIKGLTFQSEVSLIAYEKYNLFNKQELSIGKAPDNDIQFEFMNLVSKKHCRIVRDYQRHILYDTSSNGVFVNNLRVNGSCLLNFGDVIDIFGLKIIYLNELFAIGSRVGEYIINDSIEKHQVIVSEEKTPIYKHIDTFFNRSPRVFPKITSEEVQIGPPSNPQFSKKKSLLSTIGPSFTMAIPMLLGCGLTIFSTTMNGGGASAFMFTGIITALGSAILGSFWAFMNIRETKRNEIAEETQRFNTYGNYLLETAEYIKEKYKLNTDALYAMYPSSEECCSFDENSSRLWTRNMSHNDFLFCRLGVGDIDFQVNIKIPQEKFSMTYDSLKDKPLLLYENFKTLRNVPVGVNFGESNLYGIAGGKDKKGVYDVVNNIIAQIAANNSYTDVKIAFCFDAKKEENKIVWDYIKWLPHIWSENKKIRYFATKKQEVADVFFELSNIMRQRAEILTSNYEKLKFKPHYLLFVTDVSMLDGELISKYVFDQKNNYGLTTFIMTDYYQNLPNSCENIVQNDGDFCGSYNVASNQQKATSMLLDKVHFQSLLSFTKRLVNIKVREVEDDTSIVQSLDFFEMYMADSLDSFNIAEQWRKNRTYNSMKALIGKKAGGTDCYLDIHEKYHGPHGLVAGTTGSGKSELIQTLMLSLAINYSPDDIVFFVIDFKGGGMANLFSNLPHMAGQISNLSGNQIGRAMISIKSENLRRQKIFSEYGVNNINLYTRLYKSGEATIPIPHLIIIIDEFAELKKEEPDFMRELISVAQVGRSLGVHLILATQKPSGTVDDNIWSNAKFRLCLRVQDRQDSNDMLHKPDAAYITQAGRCYLQVGNDEIYELFQSGWSGAVYDEKNDSKSDIATMITPTGKTAIIGSHTKKKRKEKEKRIWYKFILKSVREIKQEFISEMNNCESFDSLEKIAIRVITKAKQNGYNIGLSNAEIKSMQSFIQLIAEDLSNDDLIIEKIIESASLSNIKLPELKEKTQLEAIVDYISQIAIKEKYTKKSQLWMPLLKKEILLNEICNEESLFTQDGWNETLKWSLDCVVGLYDDPENQSQLPFKINFAEGGHLAICGSVVSGKSTFIQTLVFSLAFKYSPDHVNFYLLDFSSGMLNVFEQLPHTGGIVRENEIDRVRKFFNMIYTIIEERKALFKGGNYSQYIKAYGPKVPAIIIAIDNFAGFKEKTENKFEDILIHLSRDGIGYGIYLVIASAGFGISEIQNRIGDNIRTVVCLEMSDKFKYMDVLRSTKIDVLPEPGVKGRGIAYVEGRMLEFQTALAVEAEDDYKRNSKIEEVCQKINASWNGRRAKQIPYIPQNPQYVDIVSTEGYANAISSNSEVPIGYNFEDASIYSINLKNTYCYSITGKKRTGKTNVLKLIMLAILKKNHECVIIEKNSTELKKFATESNITYLKTDMEVLCYFKNITEDFVQRNQLKKQLLETGKSDESIFLEMQQFNPIYIFIADMGEFIDGIYKPDENIGNMSGFFENIFEKGYLHNIYFFGCISTDEVSLVSGCKAYQLFTSYKTGIHLGGNVAAQRVFSFQNIHYTQVSKSMKKGEALVPSIEDDTVAETVIIPHVGGDF